MMFNKCHDIKSVKREFIDGFISFGWPDTKEIEHKKTVSDIAIIRVDMTYNFDDKSVEGVFCRIEKYLQILDEVYYIENETTGETHFSGNIDLIPSTFRNKKFNNDILVINDKGKLIFIIYCSVSYLEKLKAIMDIKLSKLLKMQIEAKSNSLTVDAKTVEEMLRFVVVSDVNVPD